MSEFEIQITRFPYVSDYEALLYIVILVYFFIKYFDPMVLFHEMFYIKTKGTKLQSHSFFYTLQIILMQCILGNDIGNIINIS